MRRPQRGQGAVVTLIVVILALVGLFALCNDSDDDDVDLDGIGRVVLINHEYEGDRCYRYGDCKGDSGNDDSDYRDDNRRGGISPGPFDRSPVDFRDNRVTICFPFSRCDSAEDDDQPQEPPV